MNFWSILFLLHQSITITAFPAQLPESRATHTATVNEPSLAPEMYCRLDQPDPATAVYVVKLAGMVTAGTPAQVTVFNAQQQPVRMLPFITDVLAEGQTIRLRTLSPGHYSLQIAVSGKTTACVPLIIAP